jgi:Protein kinase domain
MSACPFCFAESDGAHAECQSCGASLDDSPLAPGTLLNNRYTVKSVLGRGGFSLTYRATDTTLDRTVAIKELFPENASRSGNTATVPTNTCADFQQALAGFLQEAKTLARFQHPNIVGIGDTFTQNNTAYIVMDYVDGETLDVLISRSGRLTWNQTLPILTDIATGLEHLHDTNTIHRDIKPANIMITPTGKAVILDFGAARIINPLQSHTLTRIITPQYAAPEQRLTNARFGPPTDIFALGTLAYQAVTGNLPPSIDDRLLTEAQPEAPSAVNPTVPQQASEAILQALHLNPTNRPQTTRQFVSQLTTTKVPTPSAPIEVKQPEASPAPPSITRPTPPAITTITKRPLPKKRIAIGIALTTAIAAAAIGIGTGLQKTEGALPTTSAAAAEVTFVATETTTARAVSTVVETTTARAVSTVVETSAPVATQATTRAVTTVAATTTATAETTVAAAPVVTEAATTAATAAAPATSNCRDQFANGLPIAFQGLTPKAAFDQLPPECKTDVTVVVICNGKGTRLETGQETPVPCMPTTLLKNIRTYGEAGLEIAVTGTPLKRTTSTNETGCESTPAQGCKIISATAHWNIATEQTPTINLTLQPNPEPSTKPPTTPKPKAPAKPVTTPPPETTEKAKGAKQKKTTNPAKAAVTQATETITTAQSTIPPTPAPTTAAPFVPGLIPGDLVITVLTSGAPFDGLFEVAVSCTGNTLRETFSLRAGESKSFNFIVEGMSVVSCLVTETKSNGAKVSYFDSNGADFEDGRVTVNSQGCEAPRPGWPPCKGFVVITNEYR